MLARLLTVFASGIVGLWVGVPAGFAVGLPPVATAVTAAAGSLSATFATVLLGDRLRSWLLGRRKVAQTDDRIISRIFHRYGLIVFALLAPGLTGAPLGVVIGLTLRASTTRLLVWIVIGVALWAAALTVAGVYGSAGVRALLLAGVTRAQP